MACLPSWDRLLEAPCADAIVHQINHSPDSVVFDPYGSLRLEEIPSDAATIGSNRSDEITGHVHDYVPLPERFGGSSAPTKPDEALLRLPSDLSHLGSRRRGPAAAAAAAAQGSAAAAAKGSAATVAKGPAAAPTATVDKAAAARPRAPAARLEPARRRPRPTQQMLDGWTRCGAISKPCSDDLTVAGTRGLPPGTNHKALVASIMAAVRGFTGYRGVPHLKVNWVGKYANGGPYINKVTPSGYPRAPGRAPPPPEPVPELATATESGPRTDEQSTRSSGSCASKV